LVRGSQAQVAASVDSRVTSVSDDRVQEKPGQVRQETYKTSSWPEYEAGLRQRGMATAPEFRHMPIRALALHAQRIGRVFAAPATWARLIRERGWRRPRQRVYPAKPKEGIRATKPGELLHIDVTIIKLIDGTRAYLHAVIDNFSRRILAWKLAPRLEPATTCQVLAEAATQLPELGGPATLYADSGVENVNDPVDDLLGLGRLRRVLAQVEVTFSNSLVEAFWRAMSRRLLT